MDKLQEFSREDVGDPNIPLNRQHVKGIPYATFQTTENSDKRIRKGKFSGNFHWCKKVGNIIHEFFSKNVVLKAEDNKLQENEIGDPENTPVSRRIEYEFNINEEEIVEVNMDFSDGNEKILPFKLSID